MLSAAPLRAALFFRPDSYARFRSLPLHAPLRRLTTERSLPDRFTKLRRDMALDVKPRVNWLLRQRGMDYHNDRVAQFTRHIGAEALIVTCTVRHG